MPARVDVDSVLGKARESETKGDLPGAVKVLDGVPDASRTGGWHYARGAIAHRLGDFATAITHFEKAVSLEPEISEYRANLGASLLESAGRKPGPTLDRAITELETAVKWGPSLATAHEALGTALLANSKAREALVVLDAALRFDPKSVPALYTKAAALNAMGKLEECLTALDATLAVDPKFEPALQSKRHTLAKLGR